MLGGMDTWPRTMRTPPKDAGLIAEAAANPRGSVAVIDAAMVGGDASGYVPAEAVHGCWIVGADGILTGEYAENPHHGTPTDDFTKLTERDHYWGWLPDEPAAAVRASVAKVLAEQVPGAILEWFKVTDTPETVTGGRRIPDAEDQILLVRAGVAVPFALSVLAPDGRREVLWGVHTWVVCGLDKPAGQRKSRVWFDLRASPAWAKEQLAQRVYTVEEQ